MEKDTELDVDGGVKEKLFFFEGNRIVVDEKDVKDFLTKYPKAEPMESFVVGQDTVDVPSSDPNVVKGFKDKFPDAKPLFQDSDTTDVPSGPPIPPTRGEISEEDIPVVSMGEDGEVTPVVKLDKKTRDIFVDHATKLPDNIKLDGTRSNIFINQFSKRTGIDKRALRKIFNEGIMADEQYKQLQKEYEKNPDNTDVLYQIGGILNVLGRHDLAYEAYDALEGKLKKIGEQEFADPNNPNKRPDYVQQRQLPAVSGMAYTEELRGNKDNAQRLKKIAEQYGYSGQEFTSVGDGSYQQPTNPTPSTYGFSGKKGGDSLPTKESEYLNMIADGVGQATLIKPMSEMIDAGLNKVAKGLNAPPSSVAEGIGIPSANRTLNLVTGLAETAMGIAGMTTPAGAVFGLPFMQVQNSLPPDVVEWMMPVSKAIQLYYQQQGQPEPDWATNVAVLTDFAIMGGLLHGIGAAGQETLAKAKSNVIGKQVGKLMSEMPLEEVAQTLNHIEGKIQELGGVEQYVAERTKVFPEIAKRAEEIKQDIKLEQDSQIEVEPYEPKPQPNSLATVKEGTSVMMDGVEGIVERGDDGTWYFTTDEGKSTQIKVADKYNPTEPLTELGIQVMPEVSPEQVARAVADAEQIGEVTYKGKQYFVSLDRVGNENPSGDFVLRRMPDGTLKDVFGSHPDPKFAAERKLAIINKMLAEKPDPLPPRKKLTEVGKKVEPVKAEVEPVVEPKVEEVEVEPVKAEVGVEADVLPKYKSKSIAERFNKGLDATSVMEGGEIHPEDATQKAAWRSMGQKEIEGLLDGNEIGGSEAKKGNYFGDNPSIASSQKGEGKYLVEFGGKKVEGETTIDKVSAKDITGVWKYENGKWNKLSKEEAQSLKENTISEPVKTETVEDITTPKEDGKVNQEGNQEGEGLLAEPTPQEVSTAEGAVTPEVVGEKTKPKEDFTRNTVLSDVDKYNSLPKKERQVVGANLFAKIKKEGKKLGWDVSYNNKGDVIMLNNKGKRQKRSPVKMTEDERQIKLERQKNWREAMGGTPVDIRHGVLQYLLRGGSFNFKALDAYVGFKNPSEYPDFIRSEKGIAMDDFYTLLKEDMPELERMDDHTFGNHVGNAIAEFGDRTSMHTAILEYAGEGSEWRNSGLGFESKEHYLRDLEGRMEAAREREEFQARVDQEDYARAMEMADGLTDAEVDQMMKDLDSKFPKTEEEINRFYEENGYSEDVVNREVSDTQRIKEAGEDLEAINAEDTKRRQEQSKAEEVETAKQEYQDAKKEFDKLRAEVDKELSSSQQQDIFGKKAKEDVLFDLPPEQKGRGKALAEAKNRLEKAKEELKKTDGDTKPTIEVTKRDSAKRAIDDFADALLNLPGMKDMSKGAEKAGVSAEAFVNKLRDLAKQAVDKGFDTIEAIKDAIEKIKGLPDFADFVKGREDQILKIAKEKFGDALKADEDLFSLKNKMTDVEREALGLETRESITADQRRTIAEMQQAAKDFKGDVQDLISESINMRRTLGAEEQLVLLHEHIRLSKERRALEAEIIKQSEKGDIVKIEKLQEKVNELLAQDVDVLNAIAMTGSELGRSLSIRRLIMKQDYSLAESVRQYEATTGKEIPADLKERFAQIETELAEVTERLAELEKAKSEWDLQKAADAIKRSVESEKKARKTPTRSGDRLRALADKIEAGKINKLAGFKSSTGFDAAWDLSLKAVAESLRATAKLADAIEAGLRTIRDTDWYKALTDKQDFENKYEQHLLKEYEGAEYEKPRFTKEDNGLYIPKQLLRDLVEEGVKDANDLAQKVYEIVKEELPEVTEREVKVAISEYGKMIEPKDDPTGARLNSLKQDMKLALGLEDAEAGKGVKRSGFQRPKPTDAQREMKRKIREEEKKHPQDKADVDRKWATALDAIKTRLNNSIADNTKRIEDLKAGTAEPKTKKELTKLDAEAQALKDMNDVLKQEIENLEGKKELSDEARVNAAIAAAERATKEYERRTDEMRRTGNYTTTPNKPLPSDPKLDLAKALREQAKQNYDAALKTNNLDVIAATSKALDRAIEKERELQDKVRTGNVGYTQKAKSLVDTNNPNLVARKEAIKQLNETINAMREQAGVAEARRIELWKRRKQKSIDELEAQKAAGVYKPKAETREQPLDMEMMRLKAREDRLKFERDVALEVARMSQMSKYEKFQQHLVDIAGVPKSLLASLDLSAPLRQGLLMSARRPHVALKAGWEMIKQGLSEKKFNEWNDAMVASDAYITAKHSKLFLSEKTARLTAREEAFISNLAEQIWGAGRIVKGSNRAYSTFLNYMRMDAFTKFHDAALQSGLKGKELQANLDAYADFVNNATGRGKLGPLEGSAGVLNFFMFSPRYVTSRINLLFHGLTGYAFKQGMTNRVRVEAYKTLGAYVATVGTTLAILDAALPNASVELDPRSSDFGKLKVGNVRYDFAAGMLQPIVLFSRLLSNSTKNRYGDVEDLGSKWGQTDGLDLLGRFYRSKASPVAGTAINLYTGKDMMGDEYGYKDAILKNIIPLYAQDMGKIYDEYGASGIVQSGLPAVLGVGVQAYDKNPDLKQAKLSKVAWEDIDMKQYAPPKYSDENYTLKDKEVIVTKEDREKVNALRNEIAGKEINKAYKEGEYFVAYIGDVKMSKITREQHKKVMDTIYAKALKEAKNKVFPKGWTEKKPKPDWSNAK